ncbi:hypothetical protein G5C65_30090 [Streptomyces sp. SB3404]|uniref:Uncharacterized protein n=1 Tax=Streptomyces boncukensis TaxID=2711219 RepID=A0A6G4X785_9ACTN|nr:hypothetical protein [Streptomyces boncukensis]
MLGVDPGDLADLRAADHLLTELAAGLALPEAGYAATHLVRTGRPRIALSFALPDEDAARAAWHRLTSHREGAAAGAALGSLRHGPAELAGSAAHAAGEHAFRRAGRAVRYPGSRALTGTLTVAALLAGCAVDRVAVLGAPSPAADPSQRVRTRGHVRPQWQEGRLVLAAMPAAGGVLVPFEEPEPTPCCADHG